MRYIVTGGAGFIGSHLVRRVLDEGHKVVVIDDLSTGRYENISELEADIEFHEVDIRSAQAVCDIVQAGDIIFHEAALPSVPRSIEDPNSSVEVGVTGTLNMLMAAKAKGAKRLVFASSSSVYGNIPGLPKNENVEMNPLSPYAASKLAGEGLLQAFSESFGLETVTLRYFNVFGPRQDPTSQYSAVIPKFITALKAGDAPTIFGDGEQSRDFTYIDNVVHGNWLAAHAPAEKVSGRVMNLACGNTFTVNYLAEALNKILGTAVNPVYGPQRAGEVKHSYADIARATDLLNYAPLCSFEEGLSHTAKAYD